MKNLFNQIYNAKYRPVRKKSQHLPRDDVICFIFFKKTFYNYLNNKKT